MVLKNTNTPVLRIALPTPLRRLFDYKPIEFNNLNKLLPGMRVKVPFQRRTLIGILISVESESHLAYEKLKPALEYLDIAPILTKEVLSLCLWSATYYHAPIGEVLISALPAILRKGITKVDEKPKLIKQAENHTAENLTLNSHQQTAIDAIIAAKNQYQTFVLDGITGSGKTEVYLRAIAEQFLRDKQVLVMVPEISLTPQTIARFSKRFNVPMAAIHSGLSDKKRLAAWQAAKAGDIKLIIGTRSAIFTPFANLGLIVVDEEHDASFKQQDRFRYHARDVAVVRAREWQIPIILGSATPSLETLLNVERKRYEYLSLPERAGNAVLPTYNIIDVRNEKLNEGISSALLKNIAKHLADKQQVLLFLNRRGFSPILYCTQCAWMPKCDRCDAYLIYHLSPKRLHCHHCDSKTEFSLDCRECGKTSMSPVGFGTQRLENVLMKTFPDTPILRIDRDTTQKKGETEKLIEKIHETKQAILIGTQMLAKGHHFPNVTLVGVIDADAGLFSADFRAVEQMGQLLLQVSGRAGRAELKGTVMLQTRYPEHVLLNMLIDQGYPAFAKTLLSEREKMLLPPYAHVAILRAYSFKQEGAHAFLLQVKSKYKNSGSVDLLGPTPALLSKKQGMYCEHLLMRTATRATLQAFVLQMLDWLEQSKIAKSVKWNVEIDPISF